MKKILKKVVAIVMMSLVFAAPAMQSAFAAPKGGHQSQKPSHRIEQHQPKAAPNHSQHAPRHEVRHDNHYERPQPSHSSGGVLTGLILGAIIGAAIADAN